MGGKTGRRIFGLRPAQATWWVRPCLKVKTTPKACPSLRGQPCQHRKTLSKTTKQTGKQIGCHVHCTPLPQATCLGFGFGSGSLSMHHSTQHPGQQVEDWPIRTPWCLSRLHGTSWPHCQREKRGEKDPRKLRSSGSANSLEELSALRPRFRLSEAWPCCLHCWA